MQFRLVLKRSKASNWHPWVIVAVVLSGLLSSGCASLSLPKTAPASSHQVISAHQAKAEDTLKPLPEMTSRDYEATGDRYRRQGNLSLAFLQYDQALRLAPDNLDVRYKQSRLFLQKGRIQEAIRSFAAMIQQDATYSLAYQGLGEAYFRVPNLEKAAKNCRKAVELNPSLWGAHNCLGMSYDRQKRFQESVKAYQNALELQPHRGMLFNNLALSYYSQGKYTDALEMFQKALALEKGHTRIYNNLGMVLSKLGRHEEAFDTFAKSGNRAQAHNNLGVMHLAEGRYQKAITAFEKAIASNPNYYETASQNLSLARRALAAPREGKTGTPNAPNPKQ